MNRAFMLSLAAAGIGAGVVAAQRRTHSFSDEVAVITGGSRGLGLALARRLIAEGATVALLARDEDELKRAEEDLASRGGVARGYSCNVTDSESVANAVERVEEDFGRINLLINNAGVMLCASFDNHYNSDFESAMRTHFFGPLYAIRTVLPIMRRQGAGRILNISSIGGKIGIPHMTAYSASKHALAGFSHALAAELRQEQIYVTLGCPGLMRTGSHRAARFRGQHADEFSWFTTLAATPLLSTSAESAARKLLAACRRGRTETTFPWHWRAVAIGSAALPGLSVEANSLVNRVLPAPAQHGGPDVPGRKARGSSPPGWYTRWIERAADHYNQA